MTRKSKGRQKVNMVKMQNESNLQVTFSKRRSGLFKKASELCTLCGAEIAIIVFSPGQKVYSFGHPCVDSIVNRYLTRNPPTNTEGNQLMEAHRNASVRELNMELTHVENLLEAERKHGENLDQIRKASQSHYWWDAPMEVLNLQQLEQLKAGMENLKNNVDKEVHKLMFDAANSVPYYQGNNSFDQRAAVPFDPRAPPSMGVIPLQNRSSGINGDFIPFADRAVASTSGAVPFAARANNANSAMQFDPRAIGPSGTKSPCGFNPSYGRSFF